MTITTELALFDDEMFSDGTPSEAELGRMTTGQRRTWRRRRQLAAGAHPVSGYRLLDEEWGYRCRGCRHLHRWTPGAQSFWKCALVATKGPATDIRVSWPACSRYSEDNGR